MAWALEHLHEQFDVEMLAARAYMSRRTFDRRFRSLTGSAPLQWLITQRVLQAQRLLETSDYSVDEVVSRCGFRSPVALRGHFRRQLGSSPPRTGPPTGPVVRRGGGERRDGAGDGRAQPGLAVGPQGRSGAVRRPGLRIGVGGLLRHSLPVPDAYVPGRPALPGQRSAP